MTYPPFAPVTAVQVTVNPVEVLELESRAKFVGSVVGVMNVMPDQSDLTLPRVPLILKLCWVAAVVVMSMFVAKCALVDDVGLVHDPCREASGEIGQFERLEQTSVSEKAFAFVIEFQFTRILVG